MVADAGHCAEYPYRLRQGGGKSLRKRTHEGLTLKASALALGYLTEAEFDSWVRPEEMVGSLATRQPARGAGAG